MVDYIKFLPWLLVIVLAFLLVQKKEIKYIEVPGKTNTVTIEKPVPTIQFDTVYKDKKVVQLVPKVDTVLLEKYTRLKDSVAKLEQFKEAITERVYNEKLEDAHQVINVQSIVTGTLKEQKISYETKPQQIEVKLKKNEIYLGGTTTIPTEYGKPIGLGAQLNLKANNKIYSLGIDNHKQITLGLAFKLF